MGHSCCLCLYGAQSRLAFGGQEPRLPSQLQLVCAPACHAQLSGPIECGCLELFRQAGQGDKLLDVRCKRLH
jgi:hypothetical protein